MGCSRERWARGTESPFGQCEFRPCNMGVLRVRRLHKGNLGPKDARRQAHSFRSDATSSRVPPKNTI